MPKFSGPLKVGVVSEVMADVSGAPTVTWEWLVDGAPSKAIVGGTIKPSETAGGKTVKVRPTLRFPSGEVFVGDWTEPAIVGPAPKAPAKTAAAPIKAAAVTIPATPKSEQIASVSTVADLISAAKSAPLGTVIEMAPGDYGAVNLGGITRNKARDDLDSMGGYVWIRPKDRAKPPRITRLFDMSKAAGFYVDGLWLDGSGQCDGTKKVTSEDFPGGAPVSTAKGMKLQGCDRITIANCLFQFYHIGLECSSPSRNFDLRVIGNEWIQCGMDTVRAYCTQDALVMRHNLMHRFHIDLERTNEKNAKGAEPRHPDGGFQMDIIAKDDYTRDVVFQFNWVEMKQLLPGGKKVPDAHAVFVGCTNLNQGNEFCDARSHLNHLWDNNFIMCSDINGLAGQGFRGLTISRNVFRAPPGLAAPAASNTPNVYLTTKFLKDVKVADNVFPFAGPVLAPTAAKGEVTASGNTVSATDFPKGWETLSKSTGNPSAPDGTCGRYRIGWAA